VKAQFSVDFYIALITFVLLISYISFQVLTFSPLYTKEINTQRLRAEAFQISEILVNDFGEPKDWYQALSPLMPWRYRRPITISNPGSALTDYQVLVTLDTASLIGYTIYELPISISSTGTALADYQVRINITNPTIISHVASDGRDIRFFNQSTNNPYSDTFGKLSYWIESISSSQLLVWVKVDYIPSSGGKTIYMYYGNYSASSESSDVNTFIQGEVEALTTKTKTSWGTGTSYPEDTYNTYYHDNRNEIIYNFTDFYNGSSIYLVPIKVDQIKFERYEPPGRNLNMYRIRYQLTDANSVGTSFTTTGWIPIWLQYSHYPSAGWNTYDVSDFYWTSKNLRLDLSRDDNGYTAGGGMYRRIGLTPAKMCTYYSDSARPWPFDGSCTQRNYAPAIRFAGLLRIYTSPEPTASIGTESVKQVVAGGKMRSDCGDIRFTDSDATTLLNYWIESGCYSGNTRIWIRVTSIPASSTKTIYLYYGNPSATSASDGKATWLFFEDWENSRNASWVDGQGFTSANWEYASPGFSGNYRLHFKTGRSDTEWDNMWWKGATFSNFRLLAFLKAEYSDDDSKIHFRTTGNELGVDPANNIYRDAPGYWVMLPRAGYRYFRLVKCSTTGTRTDLNLLSAPQSSDWVRIEVKAIGSSLVANIERPPGNFIGTLSATDTTFSSGYVGIAAAEWDADRNPSFDALCVGKIASPEPSISIGNEETLQTSETKRIGLANETFNYTNFLSVKKISKLISLIGNPCSNDGYNTIKSLLDVKDDFSFSLINKTSGSTIIICAPQQKVARELVVNISRVVAFDSGDYGILNIEVW
jgi:hypothetical protein